MIWIEPKNIEYFELPSASQATEAYVVLPKYMNVMYERSHHIWMVLLPQYMYVMYKRSPLMWIVDYTCMLSIRGENGIWIQMEGLCDGVLNGKKEKETH